MSSVSPAVEGFPCSGRFICSRNFSIHVCAYHVHYAMDVKSLHGSQYSDIGYTTKLEARSHVTFAFSLNVKNGFFGSMWWCLQLTFAFGRTGGQRLNKNAKRRPLVIIAASHE